MIKRLLILVDLALIVLVVVACGSSTADKQVIEMAEQFMYAASQGDVSRMADMSEYTIPDDGIMQWYIEAFQEADPAGFSYKIVETDKYAVNDN